MGASRPAGRFHNPLVHFKGRLGPRTPRENGGCNNMPIMYCPRDQRNVETVKGYSTGLLIVLLIITLLGGIIYYLLANKPKCPFCGSRDLMAPTAGPVTMPGGMVAAMPGQPMVMQQPMAAPQQVPAGPSQPCPTCGKPLTWYAQHNRWFCAAENKWL